MNAASRRVLLLSLFALAACGDDGTPMMEVDGGPEEIDAGPPRTCSLNNLGFQTQIAAVPVGAERRMWLETRRDNACGDVTVTITSSAPEVATAEESVVIPDAVARASVHVEGHAVGETTLTARWITNAGTEVEESGEATLDVRVIAGEVPGCSGTTSAMLTAGGEVATELAGVALQEGAAADNPYHVDPMMVSVDCAEDIVPEGYEAIGPALTFGPSATVFARDIVFTIPAELGLVAGGGGMRDVLVAWQGASGDPRVVPVASLASLDDGTAISFEAPRLGTYQAIVQSATEPGERTYTYRGIGGISMGAAGSALLGFNNPDRFDFVAPLGGPVDWIHMLHYIQTWHLGGFCTEAERQVDPEGCAAGASTDRTPRSTKIHELEQNFEYWNYVDEWGGQGGTFNRNDYFAIFKDLTRGFGNPNTDHSADPSDTNILPPGIDNARLNASNLARCQNPQVIESGYYDDEYNPEGTYPVITFCDGAERSGDIGNWNPEGNQTEPAEIALAVDINGNSQRDPGEPVIRAGHELFEDCGLDQLCNVDEPGYDAETNPDPNGDDYDWQYNPNGTEANFLRDWAGEPEGECTSPDPSPAAGMGEIFSDVGLDGVASTPQLSEGGYDNGEGDGCWTMAAGSARMISRSGSTNILGYAPEVFDSLDVYSDGGIRDLFMFAANHDNLVGRLAARGMPLQVFNSHNAMRFAGSNYGVFDAATIDWDQTPRFMHVRYGDPDASNAALSQGDGGHVGTVDQAVQRILSAILWAAARWPDGDRRRVPTTGIDEGLPLVDTFDYTDPTTGRTGPTTVVLPPGYYHEAFAETEYPVMYFLHGYGMGPEDFAAVSIILQTLMDDRSTPAHRRPQKVILVFVDGKCRGGECLRGTFYAQAPDNTGGAQMETYTLGLMDEIDERYRTR